jgi:Trypsin
MWFMIKVTFGEHDRCDDSIRPETRFVLRAISQKFSYSNFDNDMALLRLNDRVPITDYIRPICLPSNKGNYVISFFLLIIISPRAEPPTMASPFVQLFSNAKVESRESV